MNTSPRKLLVLDLDETLVHATETELEYSADFSVGPYFVYKRPHLEQFLSAVLASFDVGVWTSSGEGYASQVIERLFEAGSLKFVWSSRRCTTARDWTTGEYTSIKNLSKLKKHGYPLESIIAVDDTPSKHVRNYGNLITVREFVGDRADAELPMLERYLQALLPSENVRSIEKRRWREQVTPSEADPA
jgi:carboxy-terminal domain RNA polymerase II polypeptide A small phosphatase